MRKPYTLLMLLIFIYLTGCIQGDEHHTAELNLNPAAPESGQPIELIFQIKNPQGEKVSDLEIVHEKPMHLFMVSEDLSQYFHEHPAKQTNGTYTLPFTFPAGGKFKVYIDFKPKNAEQTVASFDIEVAGKETARVDLIPDKKFEKKVDGILVKMTPSSELVRKKDLLLNFQVFDAETNKPVADLQNYLGEKAHFVIIRKGLSRFIHAHPMSAAKMAENMNSNRNMNGMILEGAAMPDGDKASRVAAMTNFPNRGIYKIFAQFKRKDKVITVPFVFEVK